MSLHETELPLGPLVPDEIIRKPLLQQHIGKSVLLEPLTVSHVPDLWDAAKSATASWTYLRYGPFATEVELRAHIERIASLSDQPFFAIVPIASGRAEGWASFCDISPANSSLEIGSIWYSPRLQHTRAGTEAMFLLMGHAFSLGYHRLVWRCNALNAASMRAAERLGFTFEGVWRDAEIAKGRRRSTAWFSLLKDEWPMRRGHFEAWLSDSNFNQSGKALTSLGARRG